MKERRRDNGTDRMKLFVSSIRFYPVVAAAIATTNFIPLPQMAKVDLYL